jgi:hypothetical protein
MSGKLIRASESTWNSLRSEAYRQHKHINEILDEVMTGDLDPTKIKII